MILRTVLGISWILILQLIVSIIASNTKKTSKPHIILIVADDLGRADISAYGYSQFQTPNIDALIFNGVNLNNFHSPSLCTPSRSALMSGKFPIFTGMQHSVLLEAEPWGLPLNLKILPGYLKDAGYNNCLIGKWHIGFFKKDYTPTKRGFDSFYGFYQGHIDYYTHEAHETFGPFNGYDLHDNLNTDWNYKSVYATDLFTAKATNVIMTHKPDKPLFLMLSQIAPHAGAIKDPLQVPKEEIAKFNFIKDEKKRAYAAMVSKLDESVGEIVKALAHKNMLENSVILFLSDNGAPTQLDLIYGTTGSNHPLRGVKATEWEGGTRTVASIWSPLLRSKQQRVSNMDINMVDVLPTLLGAAGLETSNLDIDGINMWPTLLLGEENSSRIDYPHNIDPRDKINAAGAVAAGEWKIIQGKPSNFTSAANGYLGDKYGNDFSTFDYHAANTIKSDVNTAITEFYTKLMYDDNEVSSDYEHNSKFPKSRPSILSESTIQMLRNESRIICPQLNDLKECKPEIEPCLINLKIDPCERYNFASKYPEQLVIMQQKFEDYRSRVVEPLNKPHDDCANPDKWNGAWVNWRDYFSSIEHGSVKDAKNVTPVC